MKTLGPIEELEDLKARCLSILERAEANKDDGIALAAIGEIRAIAEALKVVTTIRILVTEGGVERPLQIPPAGRAKVSGGSDE